MLFIKIYLCNNNCINLQKINEYEVVKSVKNIKSDAIGPDGIPGYIYKGCIEYLSAPLAIIFNLSIGNKQYPSAWKKGRISPIFKKGDRSDISNYRPICILSTPAKALECIIYDQIFAAVSPNDQIFVA